MDINQRYLDEVQQRFGMLTGLVLHCRDLTELGNRVGAKLEDTVFYSVALVFAAANGALHHQVRSLGESASIFGEFAECISYVE